jgi:flavin-dependent dehydrogenase
VTADVDVVVAGSGPVGLAAAVLATRAGLSACVVEHRPDPLDKACGEGLMPGAVRALAGLGVVVAGHPFRGIRYVTADGSSSADALFRHGLGLGVRRTELARALAERAELAGVERRHGVVGAVRQDRDGVEAAGVRGRWLLAADGLHSVVRQQLGLARPGGSPRRWGLRRHFAAAPWTDVVEVHWSTEAEAYVTPVADDCVGVAVLTSRRGRTYDEWLDAFPLLRSRLDGAEPASRVLGAGPLEQVVACRVDGRVLLVGDAAGYVDALTGEGIALGLAQASAAVACIAAGRARAYEGEWRRVTRRYRVLSRAVLAAAQQDQVRRAVVPAAAALPLVYGALVRALA